MNRGIQPIVAFSFIVLLTACNQQITPPQTAQTAESNRTDILYPVEANVKPRRVASPVFTPEPEVPALPVAPVVATASNQVISNIVDVVEEPEVSPWSERSKRFPQGREVQVPADVLERAQNGDRLAQLEVGKLYGEKWRFEESNVWYLKAAEQGEARAQYIMGVRYTFGQGVEQDPIEAGKWFLLGAEQGHAQSQYSVGLRWSRGEAGEPKDLVEAAKWFRLAADQGYGEAEVTLGRRYANGQGVPMDYIEAYKWLWLAKTQGKSPDAGKEIRALTPQMTAEQIVQAKRLANGFVPKPPTPLPPR